MQAGTRGRPNANILIVGESYGAEEARQQKPFIGMSGVELDKMLMEAGIDHTNCYFTNVVNARPANNDMKNFFFTTKEAKEHNMTPIRGLYPGPEVIEGIIKLQELIEQLQPKIIIGFGNYALWALTEDSFKVSNSEGKKIPTGITNYRGSQLSSRFGNIPFLPTYHPAACLRQWPWRYQVVHDLRARVRKAFTNDWDEPERNFIIRPTLDQVLSCLNNLILRAELSSVPLLVTCDIETHSKHTECIGFGWSKTDAICIPLMCSDKWEGYWEAWEEVEVILAIKKVLEHPNLEITGQNFFYDMQFFNHYHFTHPNYKQDTMLAHHVCFPGTPMGLDYLSSLYCSFHRYWKDDGKEAAKQHNDEERWVYNCRDCVVTFEVMEALWNVIRHYGLERQYAIQMIRARSSLPMMYKGVAIDAARQGEEKIKQIHAEMEYGNRLEEMIPVSVWPREKTPWYRSPIQQARLFYDELGVREVKDPKTGNRTTNDDALKKIGRRELILKPVTDALAEYRSLSTFGQFVNMKLSSDRRMRASFSPTTETFRYRSSADVFGFGRNLQNLPTGNEDE